MSLFTKLTLLAFVSICAITYYEIYRRIAEKNKRKTLHTTADVIKQAYPDVVMNKMLENDRILTKTQPAPAIEWTVIPNINTEAVWTDSHGFKNYNKDLRGKSVIGIFGNSVALGGGASDNN